MAGMHDAGRSRARLITPPFVAVMVAAFAFFTYVGVLVPIIPTFVEDQMRGGELGVGLAIASSRVPQSSYDRSSADSSNCVAEGP